MRWEDSVQNGESVGFAIGSVIASSCACSWLFSIWDKNFVVSSRTHFAILHPHFIHANFILFDFWVSVNKWSLSCSTLLGILNHLQFTLLFVFTSSRYLSSHISVVASLFYFMEQMLMLMLINLQWISLTVDWISLFESRSLIRILGFFPVN